MRTHFNPFTNGGERHQGFTSSTSEHPYEFTLDEAAPQFYSYVVKSANELVAKGLAPHEVLSILVDTCLAHDFPIPITELRDITDKAASP